MSEYVWTVDERRDFIADVADELSSYGIDDDAIQTCLLNAFALSEKVFGQSRHSPTAAQVLEMKEIENIKLRELVEAVKVDYTGIRFDDVNGENWFDARDKLQEAGDDE